MRKILTIASTSFQPKTRDAYDYEMQYRVVRIENTIPRLEQEGTLQVGLSGSLQAQWGLSAPQIQQVLHALGFDHLRRKVEDGTLTGAERLEYTTYSAPAECPLDLASLPLPEELRVAEIEMPGPGKSFGERLARFVRITESIDSLNALFKDRFGSDGQLLRLRHAESLAELLLDSATREQFRHRAESLANLATDFDVKLLKSYLSNPAGDASLNLLESLLQQRHPGNVEVSGSIRVLRDIVSVRRGYPTHSDSDHDVVAAHERLGLGYPVADYADAWEKLLAAYESALARLVALFSACTAR